jgi:hypothetical protein
MPCASSTKIEPDSRGLVPGIHVFAFFPTKDVDGRDKPGHDEHESMSTASARPYPTPPEPSTITLAPAGTRS